MSTKQPPEHIVNRAKKFYHCRLSRRLLATGLFLFISLSAMADSHNQLPTTPCNIRLVFGSDALGMPSVSYKLSLQIRNRTARDIAGVSVYWLDDKSTIIGNSAAICGAEHAAVGPSETGPCETVVQQIGGALLQRLGQATWTDIINHQLANFDAVTHCAIIGYNYRDLEPKIY